MAARPATKAEFNDMFSETGGDDAAVQNAKESVAMATGQPADEVDFDPFDYDEPDDEPTVGLAEDDAPGSSEDAEDTPEEDAVDDDELLQRAMDAGMTLKDAKLFAATGNLEDAVRLLEPRDGEAKAAGTEPEAGDIAGQIDSFAKELEVQMDPDIFDPEVVDVVSSVVERVNQLGAVVRQMAGDSAKAAHAAEEAKLGQLFDGLGKGYDAIFGTGNPTEAKHVRARKAVREEMDALRAGLKATGKKVPSDGELFMRAVGGLHGGKIKSIARKEVTKKVRGRNGQFIHRSGGSGRDVEEPKGRRRAMNAVHNKLLDLGYDDRQVDIESVF